MIQILSTIAGFFSSARPNRRKFLSTGAKFLFLSPLGGVLSGNHLHQSLPVSPKDIRRGLISYYRRQIEERPGFPGWTTLNSDPAYKASENIFLGKVYQETSVLPQQIFDPELACCKVDQIVKPAFSNALKIYETTKGVKVSNTKSNDFFHDARIELIKTKKVLEEELKSIETQREKLKEDLKFLDSLIARGLNSLVGMAETISINLQNVEDQNEMLNLKEVHIKEKISDIKRRELDLATSMKDLGIIKPPNSQGRKRTRIFVG